MKHSKLFFISLLIVFCAFYQNILAQVEINHENIPMEPGTVMTYTVHTDAQGIEVNVGQDGENRNWDFTGFVFDEFETDSILDPEDLEQAAEFPDANLIIRTPENLTGVATGDSYMFDIVADSGWYTIGQMAAGDSGGVQTFPLDFTQNPILKMPLPSELNEEWEVGINYSFGMVAPDTLMGGILDSVYFDLAMGGFSEFDAWGTVNYSGGEVEAIRQHTTIGGTLSVIGVRTLAGRRFVLPVYNYELGATQEYRWIAPNIGTIASITSLPLDEDPEFSLAQRIRLRYLPPALIIDANNLSFGEVNIGGVGLAQLTLGNEGEGNAAITRIEMKEEIAEELEPLVQLPFTIEPDSSYAIRFLWSPTGESNLDGMNIELYHNDPMVENPISITLSGSTPNTVNPDGLIPEHFVLGQNFPNPFNSTTVIPFSLPVSQHVRLDIVDMNSSTVQNLIDKQLSAGQYSYSFTANDLPAGIYIYKLSVGNFTESKKLVFLR